MHRLLVLLVCLIAGFASPVRAQQPASPKEKTPGGSSGPQVRRPQPTESLPLKSLQWLKAQQNADGSWGDKKHTLLTSLSLLAYVGHGEINDSPKFGETVKKSVSWLTALAGKSDGHFCTVQEFRAGAESRIEHAIATFALSEYYDLSQDQSTKPVVQKAVQIILNGALKTGGWQSGDKPSDADLKLTCWNLRTIRSAYSAELLVEEIKPALDGGAEWLEAHRSAAGDYRASNHEIGGPPPSSSIDSLGLAILARLTWKGDRTDVRKGMDWIIDEVRERRPVRYKAEYANLETWLYNTWASLMFGGAAWMHWNRAFQDEIVNAASADGSWPVAGGKGSQPLQAEDSKSGAIYRTAICVMMLQKPRYRPVPSDR